MGKFQARLKRIRDSSPRRREAREAILIGSPLAPLPRGRRGLPSIALLENLPAGVILSKTSPTPWRRREAQPKDLDPPEEFENDRVALPPW